MTHEQKIEAIRKACIEVNPPKVWEHEEPAGVMSDQTITVYEACRLADVLLAVGDSIAIVGSRDMGCFLEWEPPHELSYQKGNFWNRKNISWNLRTDDLTQQSEETLSFLYDILCS